MDRATLFLGASAEEKIVKEKLVDIFVETRGDKDRALTDNSAVAFAG